MNRRRPVISGVLVGVVLFAVAGAAYVFLGPGLPVLSGQSEVQEYQAGRVVLDDLVQTVSATAPIVAQERVDLAFLASGDVQEVYVQAGDRVRQGDVLADLDILLLELEVRDAEITLGLQRLALERLRAGASAAEIAGARAAVQQAAAQLAQSNSPPREQEILLAEAELNQAIVERDQALREYERVRDLFGEGQLLSQARQQLDLAIMQVETAERELESLREGPSTVEVSAAYASLAQAQAVLSRLLSGPSQLDTDQVEIQISIAELAVANARARLDDARLIAPFDGVVAVVNTAPGEATAAGVPVLTLIDDSTFFVDVLIDEIDIARIAEEDPATLNLDALPDIQLTGHVERINPLPIELGGITSYVVRVHIDPADAPLRDGMTATVNIVILEVTGVPVVPNWAIRFDRETGRAFVNVRRPGGTVEEVEVQIGVRGESVSEVLGGLSAGDEVVVSQAREDISFFGNGD